MLHAVRLYLFSKFIRWMISLYHNTVFKIIIPLQFPLRLEERAPRCCCTALLVLHHQKWQWRNCSVHLVLSRPTTITVSAQVEQNGQRSILRLIAGIVLPRIPFAHVMLISLAPIWHGWMVILPGENWKRTCAGLQYVLPSSPLDVSAEQKSS